ncbi:MAG: ATP-binding protein [Phycisphaerales bacterium JB052]
MSLRIKFFVVLALLGLTIAANVALSVWSIRFLERELAWQLRTAQPVLSGMHAIKRLGEQQIDDLGIGRFAIDEIIDSHFFIPDASGLAPQVIAIEQQILVHLQSLEQLETLRLRSGVSTTANLRTRSEEIMVFARRWAEEASPEAYKELISGIEARHELIERIEGRIIEDTALANTYGERLRVMIYGIITVALMGAALVAVFSVILLRRWVLQPIERLREGAQHFARGEFEHSIRLHTGDELGQLGDEFNHMASTIQSMQSERIERERLAAMGEMAQRTVHNLRTPLAGIRALAETTQSELDDDSDLRDVQQRIITTVDRFEGWLQGMLRVSSPLELQHHPYAPIDLVRGVIGSHRDAAKSRLVDLDLVVSAEPESCVGDPDQLEHAVTALLSNAIDFAPSGSTVTLEIGRGRDYWTLKVKDQGPGIPADLHVSVFRPYFTTRKSGTGIGLALVKRIIDQHQGSIEIESPLSSDSGPGTAFVMQIANDARLERKR